MSLADIGARLSDQKMTKEALAFCRESKAVVDQFDDNTQGSKSR